MNYKTRATRKFYAFHRLLIRDCHHYLWQDRPMEALQRLTARVWSGLAVQRPMPTVRAGRGLPQAEVLYSYQQFEASLRDPSRIVLARNGRCFGVLLHELAHELTPRQALDHGPSFTRRCVFLYLKYGRCDVHYLQNIAWASA